MALKIRCYGNMLPDLFRTGTYGTENLLILFAHAALTIVARIDIGSFRILPGLSRQQRRALLEFVYIYHVDAGNELHARMTPYTEVIIMRGNNR